MQTQIRLARAATAIAITSNILHCLRRDDFLEFCPFTSVMWRSARTSS